MEKKIKKTAPETQTEIDTKTEQDIDFKKQLEILKEENRILMEKLKSNHVDQTPVKKPDKKRDYTGIFHWYEVPGGTLSFGMKVNRHERVKKYTLVDGQEYTLPYDVVLHLIENGKYPVHEYLTGPDGRKHQAIGKMQQRFNFEIRDVLDLSNKYDRKVAGRDSDTIRPLDVKRIL